MNQYWRSQWYAARLDRTHLAELSPLMRSYHSRPGLFDSVKSAILTHDQSCRSLPDIWLARAGGVTCPSDVSTCNDCGVTFHNEGLMGQYPPNWTAGDPVLQSVDEEDGEEFEATLCECCGRKRWEKTR